MPVARGESDESDAGHESEGACAVIYYSCSVTSIRAMKRLSQLIPAVLLSQSGRANRAAATVAFTYQFVLSSLFSTPVAMLGTTISPLVAGEQSDAVVREVHAGWLMNEVLTIPPLIFMGLSQAVIGAFVSDAETLTRVEEYFSALMWGMPILALQSVTERFCIATSHLRLPAAINFIGLCVSSLTSIVLITQDPEQGMAATGWAINARIFTNFLLLHGFILYSHIFRGNFDGYNLLSQQSGVLNSTLYLLYKGSQVGAAYFIDALSTFCLGIWFAGRLGGPALEAFLPITQWRNLFAVIALGIASGTQIIVARNKNNRPFLFRAGIVSDALGLILPLVFTGFSIFAPRVLMSPFIDPHNTDSQEVMELLTQEGLPLVVAATVLFDMLKAIANGRLRGVNSTCIPTTMMAAFICIGLGLAYALGFGLDEGFLGVNLGAMLGLAACAVFGEIWWCHQVSRDREPAISAEALLDGVSPGAPGAATGDDALVVFRQQAGQSADAGLDESIGRGRMG